ncbi:unnamed protein product [Rotaria sp. Silwood1]|nr:unnamed protein product [Rotaria sp. Silwood1]CAF1597109.1 unnamed protein product [Rotaria sp. Silwood1]CAF3730639.1 unnamed protein product [Rotaria sp. Silwood1]CAF4903710.1 unnamed protein product [Rotaria sp. Silwood1]
MFAMKFLLNFIFCNFIFSEPQINFHYTHVEVENEINNGLPHNCLRITLIGNVGMKREFKNYCMNKLSWKLHVKNNNTFRKFTFGELAKQNITSQQLYLWSAPIDLAEHYQFYLNHLLTSNDTSLETQTYYNCTFPRFGSMCQYELYLNPRNYSYIDEVVQDFIADNTYAREISTCYMHLLCNRGPISACLDWREICDGQVDCINSNIDEENCWQLEINECNDNEYQCTNGQCIPMSFFKDESSTPDCLDGSDEYDSYTTEYYGICHCQVYNPDWCEDEDFHIYRTRMNISFQYICDRYTNMSPIIIEGKNETDETECEQWSCNNIYTRCDGLWSCSNGADETDCNSYSALNCSTDEHICVSPYTNQLMCISIDKANDGNIDCLGATDEPKLCQRIVDINVIPRFYCTDDNNFLCLSTNRLCDKRNDCPLNDDERFCSTNSMNLIESDSPCFQSNFSIISDIERLLCHSTHLRLKEPMKYFSLDTTKNSFPWSMKTLPTDTLTETSGFEMFGIHNLRCHHGIPMFVWSEIEKNIKSNACLCPSDFYGDSCEYQSQQVNIIIRFQALSDSWSTLFAIIISLIDDSNERIIQSFEQFTYLSMRDCKIKFNAYLLYLTQPKNKTKNYAIHIDIYEKISLTYRGSLLYPIKFPFLPMHRLAYVITIPEKNEQFQSCSNLHCIHGKCIMYSNNPQNSMFCQCNQGWSGQNCTIPYICTCSSDSICIGVSAYNRSVCVCPINKFGYRCLLTDSICETNKTLTCQNSGQCISADVQIRSKQKFICICQRGYGGDRCELINNKIILSFRDDIVLSSSIFIHFIEVIQNDIPKRTTTLRTIPPIQKSITIFWSKPFNLIFIEIYNKIYYLAHTQNTYQQTANISIMINQFDRCQNISELFNESFVQRHLLRRIKHYHVPCQKNLNLSCFYDDIHLCLCYNLQKQRLANCFEFNHNMTYNCLDQNSCKGESQCFQDDDICPTRSVCICSPCFYGTQCQFSVNGFGLSLDGILGYHIQPHIDLLNQPSIILFSLSVVIISIVVGLINGILSLITFQNKQVCEVGCGFYLIGSSITTLLTTIIFALKFWILVLAQMTVISNRVFLKIQCVSFDFLLRVCLNMDQWLNACIAIERTITVLKGINFNKKKSKTNAKIVIIILSISIVSTNIYDLFHRHLIDEENEDDKRTWCIATYPSRLQTYNSFINTFHFFAPFIINIVSAIILIVKKTRKKANAQNNANYKKLLKAQAREHKNLFIAPIILVILALPRVIISYVSRCMKSADDSWLFLIGYFISFIPPMLTFVVFVLPSKFYKEQLRQTLIAYQARIQRHF